MENKKVTRSQGGFTLIEIIAVLVILGILAAVAVPRFIDLQGEARTKGLESIVAAAQSQLSMEYARLLLDNDGDASTAWGALATASEPQATCDQVSTDGWLDTATITCVEAADVITITASHTDAPADASGTFTNPNP